MNNNKKQVRKQYILTPAEDRALAELLASDYPFPATAEVAVIRKMLRDVWLTVFPGKEFPKDE